MSEKFELDWAPPSLVRYVMSNLEKGQSTAMYEELDIPALLTEHEDHLLYTDILFSGPIFPILYKKLDVHVLKVFTRSGLLCYEKLISGQAPVLFGQVKGHEYERFLASLYVDLNNDGLVDCYISQINDDDMTDKHKLRVFGTSGKIIDLKMFHFNGSLIAFIMVQHKVGEFLTHVYEIRPVQNRISAKCIGIRENIKSIKHIWSYLHEKLSVVICEQMGQHIGSTILTGLMFRGKPEGSFEEFYF